MRKEAYQFFGGDLTRREDMAWCPPDQNRAGILFRLAARSLDHDETANGRFSLPHESQSRPGCGDDRHGSHLLHHCAEPGGVRSSRWAQRDAMREKRLEAQLQQQAAKRGHELVALETAA